MTLSPDNLGPASALPALHAVQPSAVTRGALFIVAVCAIGFAFDLSEISFGAALSGVFSTAPYLVPPGQLSWLLASIYLGAILGPPFMGSFADRRGRRAAMAVTLAFLAVTSFLSAASPGIVALSVIRGFSGIALGAYPPLMISYLTDTLPARARGRLIMITVAIAYLGPPATIFLMRWLTSLTPLGIPGWRWVIGIDGLGALVAGVLFLSMPESASWCKAKAQVLQPIAQSSRPLGLVMALSFLAPWATVSFPLLSAAFLVARGLTLSTTLLYVGISTFGPFAGALLVAPVADSIERRTSLFVCALGMAAAAIGFYLSDQAAWLMLTSFAFNLCVALYMPTLTTYTAELFSARTRGRATSWAWSVNRAAAAAVPLLMLPLLRRHGELPVFAIIVATLLATVLVILVCGPRGNAAQPVG